MKRISLEELRIKAAERPVGYYEDVVSKGVIDGEMLLIDEANLQALREKYDPQGTHTKAPEPSHLSEPTLSELASNFATATAKWAESGFKIVPKIVYKRRAEVCEGDQTHPKCEYWDGSARFGLGKCNAPGCGCTSLKRWLVTEKCPLRRWPE